MLIIILNMFFWLICAHFIADYVFQTDNIAHEKSRHSKSDLQKMVPWYYWLTAHALMHGALVAIATLSTWIGFMEAVSHWVIDFGKCEGWYGLKTDQLLHIFFKIIWVSYVVAFYGLT